MDPSEKSPPVVGIVLAGGRSSRLGGGDKTLLPLGGRPLIGHVIAGLAPQVAGLAINANGDPGRFAGLGLPVIADDIEGQPGPLAGVLAGLDWAAALGFGGIVTAAGDTPCFPGDLVARLGAGAGPSGLALAASQGGQVHPTFGLWPVAARRDLRAAILGGQRRVRDWAEGRGAVQVSFPDGEGRMFFNVNTAEDMARAKEWLG